MLYDISLLVIYFIYESKRESASRIWLLRPHGLYSAWISPGQNTGVGSLSLLLGLFPTQGSNPGLPHCWRILYQLSHKGSPRMLEWVAFPFSCRSSWPRNQTGVSCIAGRFFTSWATSELPNNENISYNWVFLAPWGHHGSGPSSLKVLLFSSLL